METQGSDRRMGFSMLFGVLGLLGAGVMLAASLNEQQVASGWGFAVAMLAATFLIIALQAYD